MKLKINTALRAMLQACRASFFTLTAISTVIGGTFAYNLHALSNNLEGAAGTYTLTEEAGTKKLSNGSETVDYTGTVIFQGTLANGIDGNMTVNVESGTHHVTYLSAGGASFDVATELNPVNLAINVSGSSNITFGSNSLLYGWSGSQDSITTNAYVNSNIDVDTTGTVGSLILTIEANSSSNTKRKFYGNQNVTYTAGTVGVGTDTEFSTVSQLLVRRQLKSLVISTIPSVRLAQIMAHLPLQEPSTQASSTKAQEVVRSRVIPLSR